MRFPRSAVLLAALQLVAHASGSPAVHAASSPAATGRQTITVRVGRCLQTASLSSTSGSASMGGSAAGHTGMTTTSVMQSAGPGSISTASAFGQSTITRTPATTSSISVICISSSSGIVTRSTAPGSSSSVSSSTSLLSASSSTVTGAITSGFVSKTSSLSSPATSSLSIASSSAIVSTTPAASTSQTAVTATTSTTSLGTTTSSTRDPSLPLLASPTGIITEPNAATYYQGDDVATNVALPFSMTLFSQTSKNVFVSTNGLFSFDTGSTSYANAALPQSFLPPMTLAAYWEDLIAEGGTNQGVYYQIDNTATGSSVTFEYILASLAIQNEYYHFLVTYQASAPGIIKVYYFATPDNGAFATIGIQGIQTTGPQAINYSDAGSPGIAAGQVVTFDTYMGTSSMTTFNIACYPLASWPRSIC